MDPRRRVNAGGWEWQDVGVFGSQLLTVGFGALMVLLLACGAVATVMVWTDSKRLASAVLARACYLGVAGAVLMSVMEYRLHGPVDAAAVLFGAGLVMWLTAEQQAPTTGRHVWLLPLAERAIRWALLRRRPSSGLEPTSSGCCAPNPGTPDERARAPRRDPRPDPVPCGR
jgi:hypothetical protein